MIANVLIVSVSAFLLGGFGIYLASRKADSITRRARRTKLLSYFFIVHLVLLSAYLGAPVVSALMFGILCLAAYELYCALLPAGAFGIVLRSAIAVLYLAFSCGLLAFVWEFPREATAYVYLVVAVFDGFSQAVGQLFGKHSLVRSISPAKTVEGALGGAALAGVAAVLLRHLLALTAVQSLSTCAWIVLAALAGDLSASWVKRKAGVKDFGTLLPGQGGILDRFDSFLFAAPIAYLILRH